MQFYQCHLSIYTFSIFNRQFKVTEDVPTIYSRERQVLLGIYIYIYIISIVIDLRFYNTFFLYYNQNIWYTLQVKILLYLEIKNILATLSYCNYEILYFYIYN